MTVLVLAAEFDPTADRVVLGLRDRDVDVCRIDTAWFPQRLGLDARLRDGRWTGCLRTPGQLLDLESVRSVWCRSPTTFRFPDGLSAPERQHAFLEAKFGLGGVLSSLPVPYVNHPARAASATKPVQLAAAARRGLAVPPTRITNDPAAAAEFVNTGATVTKLLGANHLAEQSVRKISFTRTVDANHLADAGGLRTTAHLFQRWAPKDHEARIVAVGDTLFGVAIHAHSAASRVDFRAEYPALDYATFDVNPDLARRLRALLADLGLLFAAFDLVIGDGGPWFLEANPGGQFGWLEAYAGVAITDALCDLLASGGLR